MCRYLGLVWPLLLLYQMILCRLWVVVLMIEVVILSALVRKVLSLLLRRKGLWNNTSLTGLFLIVLSRITIKDRVKGVCKVHVRIICLRTCVKWWLLHIAAVILRLLYLGLNVRFYFNNRRRLGMLILVTVIHWARNLSSLKVYLMSYMFLAILSLLMMRNRNRFGSHWTE